MLALEEAFSRPTVKWSITLAMVMSFVSFMWLGKESLLYFSCWLMCQAYFFSLLERRLKGDKRNWGEGGGAAPSAAQPVPSPRAQQRQAEQLGSTERDDRALGERVTARPAGPWSTAPAEPGTGRGADQTGQRSIGRAVEAVVREGLGAAPGSEEGEGSNRSEDDGWFIEAGEGGAEATATEEAGRANPPAQMQMGVEYTAPLAAMPSPLTTMVSPGTSLELAPRIFVWEVGGRSQLLHRSVSMNTTEEQEMVQELLESVSDTPLPGAEPWCLVRQRKDIRIWTSAVVGTDYSRIRGRMLISATPAQLLSLLIDDTRVSEYDRMFDCMRMIDRSSDRSTIRWSCYKSIWPTRPRDFVIKSTWEEFSDGTIVLATKSVDHPDYTATPTYVRGRMVMCGYVITPHIREDGGKAESVSEITMYSHTDLGGALPATIINRLCKKPAYRVLRKIQKMVKADTLMGDGAAVVDSPMVDGRHGMRRNSSRTFGSRSMLRNNSEDVLQHLIDQGVPDGPLRQQLQADDLFQNDEDLWNPEGQRLGSFTGSLDPGPRIDRSYVMAEARRIMSTLQLMASDASLGWVRLGTEYPKHSGLQTTNSTTMNSPGVGGTDSDMALYKCPIPGTQKVRMGANTTVGALPQELLGLLLESAAMLGPDYIMDRQSVLEKLSAGVGSSLDLQALGVEPEPETADDTAIYWFSCAHKRQRIFRDFVILRCYHPLPDGGGLIAYSSVDHPAYPPTTDFVRGKIEMSGFVIVPSAEAPGSSDVTFFTHLSFSQFLPALTNLEASSHYVGPLHILQELRTVVDNTLGMEPELLVECTEQLKPVEQDGGHGALRHRTSLHDDMGTRDSSSASLTALTGASSHWLRLPERKEAALRDMLALASDGECMDGPQADWVLERDGYGKGVSLWSAKVPGNDWNMVRARAPLDTDPGSVLNLLLDDSRIHEYDDLFDTITPVEVVDEGTMIKRTCYKPVWPTAPRDFSLLCSWGRLEDGSAYLVNRSIEHPEIMPYDGYVRGVVCLCGFLMVPQQEKEGCCTLTMVVHTELGGQLPATIINHLSKTAPAEVARKLQRLFQ